MTVVIIQKCPGCSVRFTATHHRQVFHSCACQDAFENGQKVRGSRLPMLLQTWRAGRNTKDPAKRAAAARALSELCTMGDEFNRDDALSQRPPAAEIMMDRWAREVCEPSPLRKVEKAG